jgi:hypothetical protein
VLIGDGWEKDGDYNTELFDNGAAAAVAQTALTTARRARAALEDDPGLSRHRDDWEQYHTRFVTPRRFLKGLSTPQ